jgi:acyl-CoA thioester hydrolase
MSTSGPEADGLFRYQFTVAEDAMDQNRHVNNVAYIQWMQDVAIRHSEATGGTAAMHAMGGTWVVRAHKIEYLSPAFAGDLIEAVTWVVDLHRVRSLRQYRFRRLSDARLLARGETDWVFVHASTGRPCAIPAEVRACFSLRPDYELP